MPSREIEVVIRGGVGCGTYSAAYAVAQTLQSLGASVNLQSPVAQNELSSGALRGVRVSVRAEGGPVRASATPPLARNVDLAHFAKIAVGIVLLLMLFGAELRLRFGLRLDMIITLAGLWIFWHYCVVGKAAEA